MTKFISATVLLLVLFSFGFLLTSTQTHAADIISPDTAAPLSPASSTIDTEQDVIRVLEKITNWMFTIFIALAAMMIIYAAFIYLTSGGGEEVSTAHKMLLYAAVAVAVATASRGLVALTRKFVETS